MNTIYMTLCKKNSPRCTEKSTSEAYCHCSHESNSWLKCLAVELFLWKKTFVVFRWNLSRRKYHDLYSYQSERVGCMFALVAYRNCTTAYACKMIRRKKQVTLRSWNELFLFDNQTSWRILVSIFLGNFSMLKVPVRDSSTEQQCSNIYSYLFRFF